jgi:hypothetical protein
MQSHRFDSLTKNLAFPLSRRVLLGSLVGGTVSGLLRFRALAAQPDRDATLVCYDDRNWWIDTDEVSDYLDNGGTEGPCCLQTKVCRSDQDVRVTQSGRCRCVCPAGQLDCDGACVDGESDTAHCGACGAACGDGETCESGSCVPVEEPTCGPAVCDRVVESVDDEDDCYASGGYLVEVEPQPVVDWCCYCRGADAEVCEEVAPKAVYAPDDPTGEGPVQGVACLAAGDVPVDACASSCAPIRPRNDAPDL